MLVMTNDVPRPLYHLKIKLTSIVQEAAWAPTLVWTAAENLATP